MTKSNYVLKYQKQKLCISGCNLTRNSELQNWTWTWNTLRCSSVESRVRAWACEWGSRTSGSCDSWENWRVKSQLLSESVVRATMLASSLITCALFVVLRILHTGGKSRTHFYHFLHTSIVKIRYWDGPGLVREVCTGSLRYPFIHTHIISFVYINRNCWGWQGENVQFLHGLDS